ncbi:MAG TPA: hypothetical protein VI564_04175 [Candidatus Nanoarchaeia archaeon]|nr:hypothetical protein [Candidatus Nanoarchaeia archaeon]
MKGDIVKLAVILAILFLFIGGCTKVQDKKPSLKISGVQELLLNEQDLEQLEMSGDFDNKDLEQLGIVFNGTPCKTEEYPTDESSSLLQYSICSYVIDRLNDTGVILEFKKFTNLHDLNGSYQYESSHLRSSEGLISENDYGDQSRFYVNNENDYGAEFNPPGIYYYTLYFSKDDYLIHVTSKGSSEEAKDSIAKIGRKILSKFE